MEDEFLKEYWLQHGGWIVGRQKWTQRGQLNGYSTNADEEMVLACTRVVPINSSD